MPVGRRPSQVTPKTILTIALNLLGVALLVYMLVLSATVLGWIFLGLFVALALNPAVAWLERRGLSRPLSVLGVLGTVAIVGTWTLFTVAPMMVAQAQTLIHSGPALLAELREHEWVQWADDRFDVVSRAQQEFQHSAGRAAVPVFGLVRSLFKGVIGFAAIFSVTLFALLFGPPVVEGSMLWLHPKSRQHVGVLLKRMYQRVGGYVAGTLIIAALTGVVTALTTFLLGVPYFLALGLMTTFLVLIPFLGSALATTTSVLMTLASQGMRDAVIALVVLLLFPQLKNRLIQPLVLRRTIDLNPFIITLVLLVGTGVGGIFGTLLALPVAGAVAVLFEDALLRRQAGWDEEAALLPASDDEAHDDETPGPHPPH